MRPRVRTPWRFLRGWSEAQLRQQLRSLAGREVNFATTREPMTREAGWTVDGVCDVIGVEAPGTPEVDGVFARARQALINYDFSDPRIVIGHFDPHERLGGRNMLLEIKVFGLHFLGGVRVEDVLEETIPAETRFGYRYDTLEGHFEQGFEWFQLAKDHASGTVCFSVEAHWKVGDFPNWWSRIGFRVVGEHFRDLWRRRAVTRLRRLVSQPVEAPLALPGALAHRGGARPSRTAG